MAITVDTLKFYTAERMTDNEDGGGQMTDTEIVSGASNQIFDDISDVDRAAGDVSIRKIYAAVISADTDKYLDAGVLLLRGPTDPDTSVLAFSTGDFYDERDAIREAVEQYRVKGADTLLRLIGTHYVNQRVLFGYLLQPITRSITSLFQDQVICVADEDHEQFVSVIRVRYWAAEYIYLVNNVQTLFDVYEVQLDLAAPLEYEFEGAEQSPTGNYVPPTIISNTQVVAPINFCGIQPLTAQATLGALSVTVAAVRQQIVPVAYTDLGATTYEPVVVTDGVRSVIQMNDDWAAPAGFSLDVTFTPPIGDGSPDITYVYGDAWIGMDHPNAATYINSTVYFPLMPDSGSRVVINWTGWSLERDADFTHGSGSGPHTGTVTNPPIDPNSAYVTVYLVDQGSVSAWADEDGVVNANGISGTINLATGEFSLTTPANTLANSLIIEYTSDDASYARTDFSILLSAPVKEGSLEITATRASNNDPITASGDSGGTFSGTGVSGTIDYASGLLKITFTNAVIASSLDVIYNIAGLVPQPKDVLGIDTNRLPKDGKVPIYAANQFVLIHFTDTITESSLSPTQVIDCEQVRLYRVVIDDVDGQRLPASFYTVDRELGTVTMATDLNLTGYTAPYTLSYTIATLSRISAVNAGNNVITLNSAVTHTYPADTSFVSNVLYIGNMQARYSNLFAQSAWTSVWSDDLIGSEPLAQYNDTLYPIEVSNLGAYKDRILIKFTSSTAFQCFGENLGLIGTGNVTEDFAPTNSLTGQPYFTIDYRGWGAGWATGNCLRFNLVGANYPVDLIRSIQPSNPTGLDDSIELCFIGNVDA